MVNCLHHCQHLVLPQRKMMPFLVVMACFYSIKLQSNDILVENK
jgi:hypothetical protein